MKWEENIRKVTPYTPGEQPDDPRVIKLNTNENPYPPSPEVLKALQSITETQLRKYPDPTVSDLIAAISKEYQMPEEQIFVGVGSDDVLAMIFLTCFHSNKPILFPDITYSFYDVWAELFGIPYEVQPLSEDFLIRTSDYKGENGGVIFPNPNAPTGIALPLEQIEEIIDANQEVVCVIDEAYIDFGGTSARSLIKKYDNLLVVQTFSKSRALAGMRIGYCFGSERLIQYLNDVKFSFNSYTMNVAAIQSGIASIRDKDYFNKCVSAIIQTREWAKKELTQLGFHCLESSSNFLFVSHERHAAKQIFTYLKAHHIYVRYFDKPRIDNYLRITVGTDHEMKQLMVVLREYLQ